MGLYDLVFVPCPNCKALALFQSKGAPERERSLRRFELATVPADVLGNVNRHSPHQCGVCQVWFAVDEADRKSIEVAPIDEGERFNNCWYHRTGAT